jgi:hypothetical protein
MTVSDIVTRNEAHGHERHRLWHVMNESAIMTRVVLVRGTPACRRLLGGALVVPRGVYVHVVLCVCGASCQRREGKPWFGP